MSVNACDKCGCAYHECECEPTPTPMTKAQFIRECIQRQVDTTDSGKLLTAYNADAVANLVKNIVGNLVMALDGWDDEEAEQAAFDKGR
jgi:hypothetical protein